MQPHGHHFGPLEAVPLVEVDRLVASAVGEQRNPRDAVGLGVGQGVLEQPRADALAAVLGANDHVLQPAGRGALGRADGEQQARHAHHLVVLGGDEDVAPLRRGDDHPQRADLLFAVGQELLLLGKEDGQKVGHLRNVFDRSLFDAGHEVP